MITISPIYLFMWKKMNFYGYLLSDYPCKNRMTMPTSGQILSWPDYHKTKENVNVKLLDLVFVYMLLSTCQ